MTLDTPNLFVQTDIALDGENNIMKKRVKLVNKLLEKYPGVYNKYVWYEVGKKILYAHKIKALYGIIVFSILYYKQFIKYI